MTRKEWRIIVIEAQRLAQNGHCIESIKLLREKAGCGLKDAHDAMRKLQDAPTIGAAR